MDVVEVLYDFEYSTKDAQRVAIKQGERLLLIKKTNNDWWQVIRDNARRPFYVPSSYVKELNRGSEFTVRVNIRPAATKESSGKKKSTVVVKWGEDWKVPDSGYCTVQVSGARGGVETPEVRLSDSLAELAEQIKFRPGDETRRRRRRSEGEDPGPPGAPLRRTSSLKTEQELNTALHNSTGALTRPLDLRPVARPRNIHKEEVIYANCIELARERERKEAEEELARNRRREEEEEGKKKKKREEEEKAEEEEEERRKKEEEKQRKEEERQRKEEEERLKREEEKERKKKEEEEEDRRKKEEEERERLPEPPTGWSLTHDPETNQPCYVHSATGDKWFSSSDGEGRIYYYMENSAESSWTLPEGRSPPPPPASPRLQPPPPKESTGVTDGDGGKLADLSGVLARISNLPEHSRRLRAAKTYSMIEHHSYKKDEEGISLGGQKHWPQLSEGKMYVLCEGPLHYTKICENGKRVRKNWTSVYVVLTELFILIYKDIKAFHSLKTQPEVTVDLNGAEVSTGEKVTGRKHVIVVRTLLNLQVALQCDNVHSALHWATNIDSTISSLPKGSEHGSSKLSSINEAAEEKKSINISRSKSVNFKNKDGSMEDLGGTSAERQMKIKARLKKFFHKRPTMESLVKKGIWKDEPVFGCYLEQACGNSVPRVPQFVQRCVGCIERSQENMTTDGLYRASGNLSQIQKIRLQIDQNNYSVLEREEDVHVLTGALKLFFRELKEPLIPCRLFSKAITACMTTNRKERLSLFSEMVKSLPACNRETLKFLLQHLIRVTQYQEQNRMHVANVAIVFGPTLMWPEHESANMALDLLQQNMVIEGLLNEYTALFK